MALTEQEVADLAEFVCIPLVGDELQEMTNYLNDAIQVLEPIRDYATCDVEPTFHPNELIDATLRADVLSPERNLTRDEALANAAQHEDGSFRVPSILGEGGVS
ncbi:aspartyl/glutamyl-tRNA amidotransferase subunit C [Collinsella sp. zg1085]|uniref:Asp-tRNA(Asn)/Glu-tRNA(Gln) amidotransferase subunit GatC n=1 Tax=Collinsella sp. zg1085 TaxID=2844380 RepID=UPI001C0D48CD|nr:Asp-tRNA(Asn)/Glu-tRNA(Gln) amidotransferase subunit GatC [Collinsella sp. zg1085]QWT17344.1 aspartyl/glutamyl-tRNA amidotransferase subunit C [Collinsella sp. zg1085]